MTDDVAKLVLNDNYLQTQAITVAEAKARELLDSQWHFMRALERRGLLDRSIEFLPDDEEMTDRLSDGQGLTRPEYAVTFAYSKLALYGDLLPTDVPDDPYLAGDLARYFPKLIREEYADHIARHRLRREIVATYVTNSLVNRVGATFVHQMEELTAAGPADIARAYVVARDAFQLRPIWRAIEALDNKVPAHLQTEMIADVATLAERMTQWFLENLSTPISIESAIAQYAESISELEDHMPEIVAEDDASAMDVRTATLAAENVPEDLASRIASLEVLPAAGDIVRIAANSGVPVVDCGRMYFAIGARLGIDWLRHAAKRVSSESDWEALALAAIIDESYSHQSELTTRVLDMAGGGKLNQRAASGLIEMWLDGHDGAVTRSHQLIDELRSVEQVDLAMLTVANAQLRNIISG
jgi:glutamate dehydrogenase